MLILHTIIQSNEVGGSYYMEKEGLHRCSQFQKQLRHQVQVLITDRHKQVNKWLREKHPHVTHYYDVWQVAKGIEIYQPQKVLILTLI